MKMYFDKFSEIGSTHKENEDYAVVGDEEHPFVIVSDGCSGSKDTGTGSRLLSLCMSKIIRAVGFEPRSYIEDLANIAIKHAGDISNLLELNKECLDSTLIVAIVRDNIVTIHAWGDGIIFFKHKYDPPEFLKINYTPEMPYYLSYSLDGKKDAQYKMMCLTGEIIKYETDCKSVYSGTPLLPTNLDILADDLEYILISTDGMETFINTVGVPINQKIIDNEVTSFKRLNGEFIGRRTNRMIKNFAKKGISHYDDFTVAGISFVED